MNLVAPESGKIIGIYVRQGEAMCEKGKEVKKGDVLISGVSNILDDSGAVVRKQPVVADGDIVIEYDKEYKYKLNRKYIKKEYNDEKKYSMSIWFNMKEIFNWNFYLRLTKKIDNYDVMVNNYNVVLCKNLYTPITILKETKYEYRNIPKEYTDGELRKKAQETFNKYRSTLNNTNRTIMDQNIRYNIGNEGIIGVGSITIRDSRSEYKEIDDKDLEIIEEKIN